MKKILTFNIGHLWWKKTIAVYVNFDTQDYSWQYEYPATRYSKRHYFASDV